MKGNILSYGGSSRQDVKRSLRLRFSYKKNNIKLVSVQSIEMIAPPSDPIIKPELKQAGFWYEVRNGKDNTLYRRFAANPIKYAVEVRSEDPEMPFTWEKVKDPKGEFTLLIPLLKEGKSIVLYSSPLDITEKRKEAKEIARFDITPKTHGKEVE